MIRPRRKNRLRSPTAIGRKAPRRAEFFSGGKERRRRKSKSLARGGVLHPVDDSDADRAADATAHSADPSERDVALSVMGAAAKVPIT